MLSVVFKPGPAVFGLFALLLSTAQIAAAKPHPTVKWTSPRTATAGAPILVTWRSRHLPNRAKLVVQRPVGTARVFKTVVRLRGRRGSAQLPPRPLGKYRYRLAAIRGERIVAKQPVVVAVFGPVPLATLLKDKLGPDGGVYAAPTVSFPYVDGVLGNTSDFTPRAAFSVEHNNCSQVHLDFITGGEAFDESQQNFLNRTSGTVTVVQETQDPVAATAPFNSPSSVDAQLTPGQTWSVLASGAVTLPEDGNAFITVYYNGYAICDSAEPF